MRVNTQVDTCRDKYNTGCMSGPEAISIIHDLGLSQARFARLAQLHPNAVTKWVNGTPPSGPVRVLLKLLRERPELVQVAERL